MSPEAPATSSDEAGAARPAATPSDPRRRWRRGTAVTAELRAQVELGRDLAQRGEDVELHGTVVNGAGGRVVAAYALVSSVAALAGLLWPKQALVLLLAVAVAGLLDLEQGFSWLRQLVPRDIGRTVVVWRSRAAAPPGVPPGAPSDRPGPRVVLCLPSDAIRPRTLAVWAWLPAAAALVLAALGAGLLAAGLGGATLLGGSAALSTGLFLAGLFFDRLVARTGEPSSGADLLHSVLASLHAAPLQHLDLCVAVVGGGSLFFDGVSVLLLNHSNRLPRTQTTVLTWAPAAGRLVAVHREGRLRPRAAPVSLVALGRALGLPLVGARSAAGRAHRLGWPALGLLGGQDNPAGVHRALLAVLRSLDEQTGDA